LENLWKEVEYLNKQMEGEKADKTLTGEHALKAMETSENLHKEVDTERVSWNRPNYKNKSTKTIAGAIKFPYLSSYNSGSPMKSRGISNQPTYKPRS
jgi:hypothetical protein